MIFEAHTFRLKVQPSLVEASIRAILGQPVMRRDRDARRQRAKAAMVIECVQHGYANAKVADVATRAKVSTATIYRDFGDRHTLLLESVELAIGIFALNWWPEIHESDPVKRVEALLLAHGTALSDPFMAWIFRLYVHLANTSAPQLLLQARAARDANLAFWYNELADLEAAGHLVTTDHTVTVALILGAVERRSIFSRLAFGEHDDHGPHLADVSNHMALALFQVYGTAKFWSARHDKPAPGWAGDGSINHGPPTHALSIARPKALLEAPSARLTAYGERILARDVNRLDGEGRKVRVQLAAMMECIEFGYEAATMASVAARAGVSTATFYNDYPDKRALFLDAILMQSRFRFDYTTLIDEGADPAQTIAALVYSISNVLADPNFLWFHRVSMASEISNAPELVEASRATRAHTEEFWHSYLASLEVSGFVEANERALTINALLGATQRRSVLSMVFFGADDVRENELSQLAVASTDFVLRLVAKTGYQRAAITKKGTQLPQPIPTVDA